MRYFVDERVGCIAVRDSEHPEYDKDYQGLNSDLEDVVCIYYGKYTNDVWNVEQEYIDICYKKCSELNNKHN